MNRIILLAALALGVAPAAFADITLTTTTGGQGAGVSSTTSGTTFIKGHKMRSDAKIGDAVRTTIVDVDAQRMYVFDTRTKQVDSWNMRLVADQLSKKVDVRAVKTSVTPNGLTKTIDGRHARGYDVAIAVPAGAGDAGRPLTVELSGPVWIVTDAPGAADYSRFYKVAAEKGSILSDPRAAQAQPASALALAGMYRRFAEIGGLVYESDLQVRMGGAGPAAKPDGIRLTTTIDSVTTGSLSSDLFVPPTGYTVSARN